MDKIIWAYYATTNIITDLQLKNKDDFEYIEMLEEYKKIILKVLREKMLDF